MSEIKQLKLLASLTHLSSKIYVQVQSDLGITSQNRNAIIIRIKEKIPQNSITWQELQIMHFPKKWITKTQTCSFSLFFYLGS